MKNQTLFRGSKIVAYADGGARGNPGPAATGVLVGGKEYGEYIGEKTNNQAEYAAVIFALKKIKQLAGKKNSKDAEVEIRMDSQLVSRQLGGRYKIKESELKPLFVDIWNLRLEFKNVYFVHVPREANKIADRIVNKVLDGRS
ncbi:MAG: ribonuclease HI family protein [Patescibacteria group bacterium]